MARPNVFVLGAQKCGTTTIADLLAAQPEIFVPSIKETYFFCDEGLWRHGPAWYEAEFYPDSTVQDRPFVADATPFYLASRAAIDRIAEYADAEARFVVALRDPVDRAYSAYWHQRRLGNEALEFREALAAEPARIARARAEGGRWWRHAYVEAGFYAGQLEHAFDRLGRERVLVLDWAAFGDSARLVTLLRRHLGLPAGSAAPVAGTHSNPASVPRLKIVSDLVTRDNPVKSAARRLLPREFRTRMGRRILARNARPVAHPAMDAEVRAELERRFASDLEDLNALGIKLSGARG